MTEDEFKSVKAGDKLVLTAASDYKPYPRSNGDRQGYVATTYGNLTLEEIDNLELVKVDRNVPSYDNVFKVGDRVKVVCFRGLVFGGGIDLSSFRGMVGTVSARNTNPSNDDRDRLSMGVFTSEVYVDFDDCPGLVVAPCCLVHAGYRYVVNADSDGYCIVDRDAASYNPLCVFSRSLPNALSLASDTCRKMNEDCRRKYEEEYRKGGEDGVLA